jgi:two-component system phosphate regulon sensor histidine kinase PhoR
MTEKFSVLNGQDPVEKVILRSMNEGVITLECNGDMFSVNPAALKILGLSEHEVKGRHFMKVFSTDPENGPFMAIFEKVIRDGSPSFHEEIVFKRHDGQKVDLAIASSFLDFDVCGPGMQSVVMVFRDITAFKSLERAKMRAVNHLSHEINTPLAIIQASVELLIRKEGLSDKLVKPVERIRRNVKRLTDIQSVVEEILNPTPFNPRPFPAGILIEEILDKIRVQSSFRAVSLTSRIENIHPDIIDPHVIRVILETLVKNAIENTPDQGEVVVTLGSVPGGILLQVQDYGVGIPISDEEFIFEAFHNTQPTDEYSSKEPFQFNAGGKGLELLRLKILSETCFFEISLESQRCNFIPTSLDVCPGMISTCPHVSGPEDCKKSGGSTFSVLFLKK